MWRCASSSCSSHSTPRELLLADDSVDSESDVFEGIVVALFPCLVSLRCGLATLRWHWRDLGVITLFHNRCSWRGKPLNSPLSIRST